MQPTALPSKHVYLQHLRGQPALQGRPAANLVLRVILEHADARTFGSAWPSMRTIAAEACISVAAVKKCIPYLVESGFLVVEQLGGPRRATRYRCTLPGGLLSSPLDSNGSLSRPQRATQETLSGLLSSPEEILEEIHENAAAAGLVPEGAPEGWAAMSRLDQVRWLRGDRTPASQAV